jgi:hypothetical protein
MIATDAFRPAQWRDFFVMVGTGAAALTGLVFVAMSLNVAVIMDDSTHRYRAMGNLTGLTSAFILCVLALMGGQHHVAVGTEMLIVSGIAGAVLIWGYVQALRFGSGEENLSSFRMIGGSSCYLLEMLGGVILIAGNVAGLYLAAVGIVVNFYFMISGAWLLLVRVRSDQARPVDPDQ